MSKRNVQERIFEILSLGISGAEDTGGAPPDPGTPPTPPTDPPTPDPDPTPDPSPTPDKVWSKAEVDAMIKESKAYRKRAQEAEAKVAEAEKAQMTELDRAKKERDEEKQKAAELEKQIARLTLEQHVVTEAASQNFATPSDVIPFLDTAAIKMDDDGKPDTNSLKAAIKRLATEKPYLIKGAGGSGSGDGGARGAHTVDTEAELQKEYQSRGMVPVG